MPSEAFALSDMLGAKVGSVGNGIGPLRDIAICLEDGAWPVVALRVRTPTQPIGVL